MMDTGSISLLRPASPPVPREEFPCLAGKSPAVLQWSLSLWYSKLPRPSYQVRSYYERQNSPSPQLHTVLPLLYLSGHLNRLRVRAGTTTQGSARYIGEGKASDQSTLSLRRDWLASIQSKGFANRIDFQASPSCAELSIHANSCASEIRPNISAETEVREAIDKSNALSAFAFCTHQCRRCSYRRR